MKMLANRFFLEVIEADKGRHAAGEAYGYSSLKDAEAAAAELMEVSASGSRVRVFRIVATAGKTDGGVYVHRRDE